MSRESIETLKARLLRDPEVQEMIRMRAYEVYQMRGGHDGNQAEDWFRAESEVLTFLIEEENRQAGDKSEAVEAVAGVELVTSPNENADPETNGGEAVEAPKKRTRSTTKLASAGSKKTGNGVKSTAPRASKKAADGTEKPATRRAAAKKPADTADKPKRTRKKAETPVPQANE